MLKKLMLIICFILISSQLYARPNRNSKQNKFFLQGLIGRTSLTESKDVPSWVDDSQKAKTSTGLAGTFGYRWKTFSLEFVAADLGNPYNEIGDTYKEQHSPLFIGGGLHWTWAWFDLKLGWGSMKDKVSFKQLDSATTTVTATPNKKSTNSTAGYFGLGLNFDLGADTELVIDYTAYAWTLDEQRTFSDNGSQTDSVSDSDYAVGILGIGLRWFL